MMISMPAKPASVAAARRTPTSRRGEHRQERDEDRPDEVDRRDVGQGDDLRPVRNRIEAAKTRAPRASCNPGLAARNTAGALPPDDDGHRQQNHDDGAHPEGLDRVERATSSFAAESASEKISAARMTKAIAVPARSWRGASFSAMASSGSPNEKKRRRAGASGIGRLRPILLDLALAVLDVLARDRVVLLHHQLLGLGAGILLRHVEVAGVRGEFRRILIVLALAMACLLQSAAVEARERPRIR